MEKRTGGEMIIYISGPILGNPNYEKEFEDAEQYLFDKYSKTNEPLTVLNPVKFSKAVAGFPLMYKDYLDIDLKLLELSTHIFFLKNFPFSEGCKMEYQFALEHNIKMLYQE